MTPYSTRANLNIAPLGDSVEAVLARCPYCYSHVAASREEFHDPRAAIPWRIAQCADCGQTFTSPRPRDVDWRHFYRDDYKPHQVKQRLSNWRRRLRGWLQTRIAGYRAPDGISRPSAVGVSGIENGRRFAPRGDESMLLDIGCGAGEYLAEMRSLGWDVLGLDRSRRAAELARTHFGVPVIVGTLPTDELPTGEFDLVTLWQVLEHLDRPRRALACIRALLRPGGRLMLTVPNLESWAARTFGPAWIGLDLPRHLTHFTPRTLSRMLGAEGFDIIRLTTFGQSGWTRHSARAFPLGAARRCFASKLLSRLATSMAVRRHAGDSIYVLATPA